jgi:hypothetical protein
VRPVVLIALILSNGRLIGTPPPVRPAAGSGSVTLAWSAPGDDSLSGVATEFDLRMSTEPLGEADFALASRIPWAPPPGPPGTTQRVTISGLVTGQTYYFALKTRDEARNWSRMSNVLGIAPGASAASPLSAPLAFLPPAPNPARSAATLTLSLPAPGRASLAVHDLGGRRVRRLADQEFPTGSSTVVWDLADDSGARVAPGTYFARATLAGSVFVRRVVVVR